MFRIQLALFASLIVAACVVGDQSTSTPGSDDVAYLDTNGDGNFDAIDTDGDGVADYYLACGDSCTTLHAVAFCANPLVDANHDGTADGLDTNCDGVIDIPFGAPPPGGGGSSGGNRCQGNFANNGVNKGIDCTDGSCKCSLNGTVVSTCSTTAANPCSLSTTCCTF